MVQGPEPGGLARRQPQAGHFQKLTSDTMQQGCDAVVAHRPFGKRRFTQAHLVTSVAWIPEPSEGFEHHQSPNELVLCGRGAFGAPHGASR